jgi:hypothetical protein
VRQRDGRKPVIRAERLDRKHQDIELPHTPKLSGDFPETPAELSGGPVIELQERQQLAESSGGHAGSVQGFDVAAVEVLEIV